MFHLQNHKFLGVEPRGVEPLPLRRAKAALIAFSNKVGSNRTLRGNEDAAKKLAL